MLLYRDTSRDHRDEVIAEMALAFYDGSLAECDIEKRAREYGNRIYRQNHNQFGSLSLDVPLFHDSDLRRIDLVTENIWQQA
jgi:hypothetical protein